MYSLKERRTSVGAAFPAAAAAAAVAVAAVHLLAKC